MSKFACGGPLQNANLIVEYDSIRVQQWRESYPSYYQEQNLPANFAVGSNLGNYTTLSFFFIFV